MAYWSKFWLLGIEDKLNLTLVINWCLIYKTRYSIEPRGQVFVKGYEFLSFAGNMDKNTYRNVSKSLSGK